MRLALAVTLVLFAAHATAQLAAQPSAVLDCSKADAASAAACGEQALQVADGRLKEVYAAALAMAAGSGHLTTNQRRDWKRALQEAQRAWLAFREADCGTPIAWERFQSARQDAGQNPAFKAATVACKTARTEQRAADLKSRYPGR